MSAFSIKLGGLLAKSINMMLLGSAVAVIAALVVAHSARRAVAHPHELALATRYLESRIEDGDVRRFLLLHFLARTYKHVPLTTKMRRIRQLHCRQLQHAGLAPFCRFVDSTNAATAEEVARLESPTDRLLATSIHCHQIELGDRFFKAISTAAKRSGYDLTHASMAIWIALQEGCEGRSRLKRAAEAQASQLARLVHQEGPDSDLGLEALIMLFALETPERVQVSWIATALQAQNGDGGWGASPGRPSWDHSSILGYWLLLELNRHPTNVRRAIKLVDSSLYD